MTDFLLQITDNNIGMNECVLSLKIRDKNEEIILDLSYFVGQFCIVN